ncbi:MAG: hypothetical protein DRH51_01025 [Candidatus Coatesbacteria bacterium]|nr:MAG: hypothetical protein DRH51_01025 [Candidatus Coatesbacteria bacterium]
MFKRCLYILLLSLLLSNFNNLFSEEPIIEWTAYYDYESDFANDIEVDSEGNVYVVGDSASDFCMVKYNNDGNEVWVRRYHGDEDKYYNKPNIKLFSNEDGVLLYLLGRSITYSGYFLNFCTVKYDSDGNFLWAKEYDGPGGGNDYPSDMVVDSEGNVYVTGSSEGEGTGLDYCTIKYDSEGNEIWVRRYDGEEHEDDYASGIAIGEDDCIYVTGACGEYWDKIVTIKYDSEGNEVWVRSFEEGYELFAFDIDVNGEGDIYIAGDVEWSFLTIKYNSEGDLLWYRVYEGGSGGWYPYFLDTTPDNGVVISGTYYGMDSINYRTICYDVDGNLIWANNCPEDSGSESYHTSDLNVDDFGSVYGTGNYRTVKYDREGNELWLTSGAEAIALGEYPYFYTTDTVFSGDADFLTIKYRIELTYITLLSFTADASGASAVNLRWSIATDEGGNIAGFNLYRRVITKSEKTLAGDDTYHRTDTQLIKNEWHRVNSTIITGTNPYSYTDTGVAENTQYEYKLEVVLTDNEGGETLGTTTVETGIPAGFTILRLYPNPVSDIVNCILSVPHSCEIEIAIYDISGRRLLSKEVHIENKGKSEVSFGVDNLADGVYSLIMSNGATNLSRIFVIAR